MRTVLGLLVLATGCVAGDSWPAEPAATQEEAEAAATQWVEEHAQGLDLGTEVALATYDPFASRGCFDARSLATPFRVTTSTLDLDVSFWCDAEASPSSQLRLVTIRNVLHGIDALNWEFVVRPASPVIPEDERGTTGAPTGNVVIELSTSIAEVLGTPPYAADPMITLPLAVPLVARIEIDRAFLSTHLRSVR